MPRQRVKLYLFPKHRKNQNYGSLRALLRTAPTVHYVHHVHNVHIHLRCRRLTMLNPRLQPGDRRARNWCLVKALQKTDPLPIIDPGSPNAASQHCNISKWDYVMLGNVRSFVMNACSIGHRLILGVPSQSAELGTRVKHFSGQWTMDFSGH
jgi:hypothetical protein